MTWQSLKIAATEENAGILSDALMDLGALSVSIEDAHEGTDSSQPIFAEPGEASDALWHHSFVIALFSLEADIPQIVADAVQNARLDHVPPYTVEAVEDQDWVRLTQSQFDPIQITPRLWIVPTWHEAPNPDAINLALDPGLAFGTGSHPTTRLCLEWLDANIHGGETVVDYGCGSGILAIAAMKLGAGRAIGVDIDPQAMVASRANAAQNAVTAEFYLPDETPAIRADVVVANILSNPLKVLAPMLAGLARQGGHIVLSGVLAEQAEEVNAIYQEWCDMAPPRFEEGWALLTGARR
jgi:ribosomal protein L11 methyltransferase